MAFASTNDVATRLGRDLDATETGTASYLLDAATSLMTEAAGKTDDWAAALSPVPSPLRFLAVEIAARIMQNPEVATTFRERLGEHSIDLAFSGDTLGLRLTKEEELMVRRVVWGTASTSQSIEQDSHATLDYPWITNLRALGPDDPAYYLGGET